jgi:hypothetical protein
MEIKNFEHEQFGIYQGVSIKSIFRREDFLRRCKEVI